MILKHTTSGIYNTNCYLLVDEDTNQAVLFDVGADAKPVLELIKNGGYELKTVFITHGHFDHVDGLPELISAIKTDVVAPKQDLPMIKFSDVINKTACNDELFEIGGLKIKAIHTPGHSEGSTCYLCDNFLFSGDTLFRREIGRTDLYGGDYDTLINSVKDKLFTLNPDIKVFPGHGLPTTIAEEKAENPYFKR